MRKKLTDLVKVDLLLETINQISLQVGLLLLSETNTPTTGGLDTFFEKTDNRYLIISILWSIKTSFSQHLKHVSIAKPYLEITSKVLVYIMAALAASKRILVMVMFFVPGLGLFSILHHWQAEQIPFDVSKTPEGTFFFCPGIVSLEFWIKPLMVSGCTLVSQDLWPD